MRASPLIARDLLMCVGLKDVDRLFMHSLVSCCAHLASIRAIYIVTPSPHAVREKIKRAGVAPAPIYVRSDEEVLGALARELPGWSRQQAIKLSADQICGTEQILCIGADTVLLQQVNEEHLSTDGVPILYAGGSATGEVHLNYERERLRQLAAKLGVSPDNTARHADFIMDLFVFDASILRALRAYLDDKFGAPGLSQLLPRACETPEERVAFGEWTLYALFALDVAQLPLPVRASNGLHLAQVHSQRDLARFEFNSRITHFVSKEFDLRCLVEELSARGATDRFP